MSLSSELNKKSYSPSAGTTVFDDWDISYFDDTDVVITIESALGVVTEYVDETNFEVVATNGDPQNGATITLNGTLSGGTTAGDTVVISRQVPYTQEYDLQDGSSIDPTALNRGLDRTVAQSQQLLDDGERHLTHPITDPSGLTYDAPAVVDRASKATGWDADGNVTALSLSDSGTVTGNEDAGISVTNNIISAKVDATSIGFDGTGQIEVKSGGIIEAKLATDAVTPDKIQALAVTNAKIADSAVDTEELAAGAVTLVKIDADASTTARGVIEQATDGETITGSDPLTAVSPSNITALFNDSGQQDASASGYQKLPGGLILQWGTRASTSGSNSVVFPDPFPTAVFSVITTVITDDLMTACITASSATGFSSRIRRITGGGSVTDGTSSYFWQAIGH